MNSQMFGALAGLKVVDLSRVLAGPFCSQILADHGATVIKVEPPRGDETRTWGTPLEDGTAPYFRAINRNKRGIALDFSKPAGREVLLKLLADADVVLENFKAGTMDKWGLGYEDVLAPRFPRLIHCRITGFGADGPLGGAPGYDAVVQAIAGLMSVNGTPDSGPVRLGLPIVDLGTGLGAVIGILLAVIERGRSGRGQFIDSAMFDRALSLLVPYAANWFFQDKLPQPMGNAHPNVAPYNTFSTATGEIMVGIGNDNQFRKFCEHIGRPDLPGDPLFRNNAERNQNREKLEAHIREALLEVDGAALCKALLAIGVPAGPVHTIDQVLDHPHTRHRKMVAELDGYRGTGVPLKLSRTPGSVHTPPPRFGEHTREVLAEYGFSADEIESIIAEGAALAESRPTGGHS